MAKAKKKVLKSFLLPIELVAWLKLYAKANNTTMTQLIVDNLTEVKQKSETNHVEQI